MQITPIRAAFRPHDDKRRQSIRVAKQLVDEMNAEDERNKAISEEENRDA